MRNSLKSLNVVTMQLLERNRRRNFRFVLILSDQLARETGGLYLSKYFHRRSGKNQEKNVSTEVEARLLTEQVRTRSLKRPETVVSDDAVVSKWAPYVYA